MGESEVARLRAQIETEMVAMQRGLYGFAAGMARHDFINARMENIARAQEQLSEQVGEDEARRLCCETYIDLEKDENQMDGKQAANNGYGDSAEVAELKGLLEAESRKIVESMRDTTLTREQSQECIGIHRERMDAFQGRLARHVGNSEAAAIRADIYARVAEIGSYAKRETSTDFS
jgi:hypothetical protein